MKAALVLLGALALGQGQLLISPQAQATSPPYGAANSSSLDPVRRLSTRDRLDTDMGRYPYEYPGECKAEDYECPRHSHHEKHCKPEDKECHHHHDEKNCKPEEKECHRHECKHKYIVKLGDYCWKVAREHGCAVDKLRALNPWLSHACDIYPGDVVCVPNERVCPPMHECKPCERKEECKKGHDNHCDDGKKCLLSAAPSPGRVAHEKRNASEAPPSEEGLKWSDLPCFAGEADCPWKCPRRKKCKPCKKDRKGECKPDIYNPCHEGDHCDWDDDYDDYDEYDDEYDDDYDHYHGRKHKGHRHRHGRKHKHKAHRHDRDHDRDYDWDYDRDYDRDHDRDHSHEHKHKHKHHHKHKHAHEHHHIHDSDSDHHHCGKDRCDKGHEEHCDAKCPWGGRCTHKHKVCKGDTCWKISRKYRISEEHLRAMNPWLNDWCDIYPGEVLCVEGCGFHKGHHGNGDHWKRHDDGEGEGQSHEQGEEQSHEQTQQEQDSSSGGGDFLVTDEGDSGHSSGGPGAGTSGSGHGGESGDEHEDHDGYEDDEEGGESGYGGASSGSHGSGAGYESRGGAGHGGGEGAGSGSHGRAGQEGAGGSGAESHSNAGYGGGQQGGEDCESPTAGPNCTQKPATVAHSGAARTTGLSALAVTVLAVSAALLH